MRHVGITVDDNGEKINRLEIGEGDCRGGLIKTVDIV